MTKVTINGLEFTEVFFKITQENDLTCGELVIIGDYRPSDNLMIIDSSKGIITAHKVFMHHDFNCDTTRFILNIVAKTE